MVTVRSSPRPPGAPARAGAPPARLDETALGAAYAAHAGALLAFAGRLLGDHQLAEEAVQETFVRAWLACSRFDPLVGSLRSWLFTIARNVVVDLARARAARPSIPADAALLELLAAPEEDDLDHGLRALEVDEALSQLSPEHREALVETYLKGRPARELAAELGIPEGTVRSRCYYGLRAARLAIAKLGLDRA